MSAMARDGVYRASISPISIWALNFVHFSLIIAEDCLGYYG